MKRTTFTIALALTLLGMSSCKKADTTNSGTLIGTWKKPYMSYTVGATFKSDNTFSFGIFSGPVYTETITGNYSATSTAITFTNQSGTMESCPGVQCTYNYAISGNTCVISDNTDPCTGRNAKMDGTFTQ